MMNLVVIYIIIAALFTGYNFKDLREIQPSLIKTALVSAIEGIFWPVIVYDYITRIFLVEK